MEVEPTELTHVVSAEFAAVSGHVAVPAGLMKCRQRVGSINHRHAVPQRVEHQEIVITNPADDHISWYSVPRIAMCRHDEVILGGKHE